MKETRVGSGGRMITDVIGGTFCKTSTVFLELLNASLDTEESAQWGGRLESLGDERWASGTRSPIAHSKPLVNNNLSKQQKRPCCPDSFAYKRRYNHIFHITGGRWSKIQAGCALILVWVHLTLNWMFSQMMAYKSRNDKRQMKTRIELPIIMSTICATLQDGFFFW